MDQMPIQTSLGELGVAPPIESRLLVTSVHWTLK